MQQMVCKAIGTIVRVSMLILELDDVESDIQSFEERAQTGPNESKMGYPKLRASLRHLSRNSNSEVLAGRATVEVGGVWTVEEDVSQNTVRGGTREGGARLQTNDY